MSETLDAVTKSRLNRGEVVIKTEEVPGASVPALSIHALIEAAPEQVWQHIDQSGRYGEFMPRVKEARELSREGQIIRTRMTLEMPFPLKNLSATTRATHTVEPGVSYTREWKMEEGDYHRNEGVWRFTPYEGNANRTLVLYRVHAIPKIPIPKTLQAIVQEKAMPKMIEALRDRVKRSR